MFYFMMQELRSAIRKITTDNYRNRSVNIVSDCRAIKGALEDAAKRGEDIRRIETELQRALMAAKEALDATDPKRCMCHEDIERHFEMAEACLTVLRHTLKVDSRRHTKSILFKLDEARRDGRDPADVFADDLRRDGALSLPTQDSSSVQEVSNPGLSNLRSQEIMSVQAASGTVDAAQKKATGFLHFQVVVWDADSNAQSEARDLDPVEPTAGDFSTVIFLITRSDPAGAEERITPFRQNTQFYRLDTDQQMLTHNGLKITRIVPEQLLQMFPRPDGPIKIYVVQSLEKYIMLVLGQSGDSMPPRVVDKPFIVTEYHRKMLQEHPRIFSLPGGYESCHYVHKSTNTEYSVNDQDLRTWGSLPRGQAEDYSADWVGAVTLSS